MVHIDYDQIEPEKLILRDLLAIGVRRYLHMKQRIDALIQTQESTEDRWP